MSYSGKRQQFPGTTGDCLLPRPVAGALHIPETYDPWVFFVATRRGLPARRA
jgi:hypothetical protein